MITSIMNFADDKNEYEIIILHSSISLDNQKILTEHILQKNNFSVRFIDVTEYIANHSLYTENRDFFTAEAYYRLLAPYLLPEYDKAIYMDGDMVALTDVAELFDIDIENYMIAAVRDYCGISDSYNPDSDRKVYMEKELKLKNFENYYISGLLVLNLKMFREKIELKEMMQLASSRNWRCHDQDILNIITENKTMLLNAKWNVLQDYGTHHFMPDNLYREWKESYMEPYIVHFGGDAKPWRYPRVKKSNFFWDFAKETPYLFEIKHRTKEELKNNKLYRIKYMVQFLFPLGSKSRVVVKRITKPIWQAIKKHTTNTKK